MTIGVEAATPIVDQPGVRQPIDLSDDQSGYLCWIVPIGPTVDLGPIGLGSVRHWQSNECFWVVPPAPIKVSNQQRQLSFAYTTFAAIEIFPPELIDQFDEGRIFGNDLRVQTTKWGVVKGPDLFAAISKSWAACRN